MKKLIRILGTVAAFSGLLLSLASLAYTHAVDSVAEEENRRSHGDTNRLFCHIREMESSLSDLLSSLPQAPSPSLPVSGNASTSAPDGEDGIRTEALTIPTQKSPETLPPSATTAGTETASPSAPLYVMAEQDGIIAVFDASGDMVRQINVCVRTLPESDREALADGIPADSWEDVLRLISLYE